MSSLTFAEKRKLEKLFGMSSGYVLNFTDRTFREFVFESTGKDVYAAHYKRGSGSKANCLRGFWFEESDYVVGKLVNALLDYYGAEGWSTADQNYADCCFIAERLLQSAPVQDIQAITPNADGREFDALAKSVKEAIDKNEPENGLDRLHTFVVKYVRVLCEKRGITVNRDKPLHSIFGEYVKKVRSAGLIESEMTDRILKSSISIMEAFNEVRNQHSLAHANPTLGYSEALLIFNNVASAIRFIAALEEQADRQAVQQPNVDEADIPL